MAWKMWRAPATPPEVRAVVMGDGLRQTLGGLALTLGNPKTMIFFLAILPQVISLREMTPVAVAELCILMATVLTTVMTAYAMVAARARRFISKPSHMRIINRATGGLMAGVAVAVATR
jgi:threonine/homoserine/homoserine lactone efflux protein